MFASLGLLSHCFFWMTKRQFIYRLKVRNCETKIYIYIYLRSFGANFEPSQQIYAILKKITVPYHVKI